MNKYALTIKKHSHPVFVSDYEKYIEDLKTKYKGIIIDEYYERGSVQEHLHIHAVIHYNKRLTSYCFHHKDFHTLFKIADDKWVRYCNKHEDVQDLLLKTCRKEESDYINFNSIK